MCLAIFLKAPHLPTLQKLLLYLLLFYLFLQMFLCFAGILVTEILMAVIIAAFTETTQLLKDSKFIGID